MSTHRTIEPQFISVEALAAVVAMAERGSSVIDEDYKVAMAVKNYILGCTRVGMVKHYVACGMTPEEIAVQLRLTKQMVAKVIRDESL